MSCYNQANKVTKAMTISGGIPSSAGMFDYTYGTTRLPVLDINRTEQSTQESRTPRLAEFQQTVLSTYLFARNIANISSLQEMADFAFLNKAPSSKRLSGGTMTSILLVTAVVAAVKGTEITLKEVLNVWDKVYRNMQMRKLKAGRESNTDLSRTA